MAAAALSVVTRLALGVDDPGPGWIVPDMSRHGRRWSAGDALALDDRTVNVIASAIDVATLERRHGLRLLHECRRVLRGGGHLCMAGSQEETRALALLAGLVEPPPGAEVEPAATAWMSQRGLREQARFVKPARGVAGEPLVTLAIPAYGARFFSRCLASALAQTYRNVEIVVCDDSRDDAIERMTHSLGVRAPSLRYRRNPSTLGVRANYRRCLEEARGEFVKFLCDDDVLAPTCVAALMEGFRRAPDIALAVSHRRCIDESGAPLADLPATVAPVRRDAVIAGRTLANVMVMAGVNIVGEPSTALLRKADLVAHAPDYFTFDGAHGHGIVDMVTWASLLMKGDAVYLRDSLSSFRIHPGQRQNDPAKRARNSASVHELQRLWGGLCIHEWGPPEHLMIKPFPPAARDPWRLVPVRSPAARLALPTFQV